MVLNKMIEKIEEDGNVLAIVVRSDYQKEGLNFFTDEKNKKTGRKRD